MREQGEKKTEPGNEEHLPNDQTIESKTKRFSKLFPKGSGMKISSTTEQLHIKGGFPA